ncbi:hypothetical protein QUF90_14525 [Desulfococcaceae bacterium HSG9]|nr:hypothetical protein [Desulfococcaceae bacterium HSG9]
MIRVLAEELDKNEYLFPFELDKVYHLPTPYNTFGAAEILMNTLKTSDVDEQQQSVTVHSPSERNGFPLYMNPPCARL